MNWFKKFFLYFKKRSEPSDVRRELNLLKLEFAKVQEDQKVLILFCKDSILSKIKQIDILSKNVVHVDGQIVKINELINQHADSINALIENYKGHITNAFAHEDVILEEEDTGKKQRNDN